MGSGDDTEPEVELDDEDVAQLLYTSGTTAAPKGAMLTHRALMYEYVSCIAALEYHPDDRAIAALPLYHSAQMHVFLMPILLVGGVNYVVTAPDPEECCKIVEQAGGPSFEGSTFCSFDYLSAQIFGVGFHSPMIASG